MPTRQRSMWVSLKRPMLLWSIYARYRLGAAEPSPLVLLKQRWMDARLTLELAHGGGRVRRSAPRRVESSPVSTSSEVHLEPRAYMPINPDGVPVYDWDFPHYVLGMGVEDADRAQSGEESGLPWYRAALHVLLRR